MFSVGVVVYFQFYAFTILVDFRTFFGSFGHAGPLSLSGFP